MAYLTPGVSMAPTGLEPWALPSLNPALNPALTPGLTTGAQAAGACQAMFGPVANVCQSLQTLPITTVTPVPNTVQPAVYSPTATLPATTACAPSVSGIPGIQAGKLGVPGIQGLPIQGAYGKMGIPSIQGIPSFGKMGIPSIQGVPSYGKMGVPGIQGVPSFGKMGVGVPGAFGVTGKMGIPSISGIPAIPSIGPVGV